MHSRPSFPRCGLLALFLGAASVLALQAQVHESSLAGTWYPASADALRQQVDSLLTHAQPRVPASLPPPMALVVPHAGYQYSGLAAAAAYTLLQRHPVRRIFLLGFSHSHMHRGIAVPDYAQISTPLGVVQLDTKVMQELRRHRPFRHLKQLDAGDHSVEIQLPFLQQVLSDFTLVPLYVGELSEKEVQEAANVLRPYLEPGTCFVTSSDFTHYGPTYDYVPFPNDKQTLERLRELDSGAIEKIVQLRAADFQSYLRKTGDTVCGRNPIVLLLHLLTQSSQVVEARVLEYYTSGQLMNDFTNSVSYAALAFSYFPPSVPPLEPGEQHTLLKLARDAIQQHLEQKDSAPLDLTSYALTPRLRDVGAVFVTLRLNGELRGCIGQLQSSQPLYEAVRSRAVAAAVADPRFPALQPAEFRKITIEISVLQPLRRLTDWREVELGRDGIMIRKGDKGAIFLPEVAQEFRFSREEFWAELCRKAGLPRDAYKEKDADLFAFTADAFTEPEPPVGHSTGQ